MSWVPISNCTNPSSICTHNSPYHVSQIRVAAPHTLPLPLHHSRTLSWHPSCVSSISSLQPEQVLIWWKCIWLQVQNFLHNLFLPFGRSHNHNYLFIFLYAGIYNMLDLVDPLGSQNKLPLWSRENIPDIILHDRLVLLDHSILPFFLLCRFFIVGRFFIDDVTQQGYITGVWPRSLSFFVYSFWSAISLCI